jgi:two-component system, cell cycle sensor histidine kinase and response regulator CckA
VVQAGPSRGPGSVGTLAAAFAFMLKSSQFERLFLASPVAMSVSRLDDRTVVAVNAAYERSFGVTAAAILTRTPADVGIVVRNLDRDDAFARLRADPVLVTELELETPAGPRAVMLQSQVIELDGVAHVLSTFLDATDQRRAEAAAEASDAQLRELAENVNAVFWLTDPDNTVMLYISPAYERIFGRSGAALYANARDWVAAVHADDRDTVARFVAQPTDRQREVTYRIVRPDGKIRSIHVTVVPIRDAAGAVIRVAGVGEDVTDRLQLEEQLRQTQKLESLGLLAGGIAHDFNNILAVIAANGSIMTELVPAGHPDRELVDEIEAAVTRGTSLTRQLLAFSRKQVVEPVVLDLNKVVSDTRKMLRRMVGEDIVIKTSLDPELGHVRIDPGYLVQVLMNLAVNARDAMPRGGTLTLTTRTVGRDSLIEVADTGCGMTPEVKARAFEPFFTTKGLSHGTGLGLSVVHGIVDQAGGRIELESEPGLGTTLWIYLPHVDAPADELPDVADVSARGAEKVIVVDDDLFVRGSTSRALRTRGYQVLEAADGDAALRLLRDHGSDVALLLTDVVMPGMDGRELVEQARSRRPSLKVLYMTGYTDDATLRHGVRRGEVLVLEKPFRSHTLAGRVRQVLDGPVRAEAPA